MLFKKNNIYDSLDRLNRAVPLVLIRSESFFSYINIYKVPLVYYIIRNIITHNIVYKNAFKVRFIGSFKLWCFNSLLHSKCSNDIDFYMIFFLISISISEPFFSCFSILIYIYKVLYSSYQGHKANLEITGYSRRAWYNKGRSVFLYLKIGKSKLSSIVIASNIYLKLTRKRFLKFFSFNEIILNQVCIMVYRFKPADVYTGGGIKYNKYPLRRKVRRPAK